jgi:hypothetical protein
LHALCKPALGHWTMHGPFQALASSLSRYLGISTARSPGQHEQLFSQHAPAMALSRMTFALLLRES